jgi:uncharacterized membrane protein
VRPSETSRIEAFSDGVFAIAITLLILNVQVPQPRAAGDLGPALFRQWPTYLAFVASFATIGVMWVNHHRLFSFIERSDEGLVGLNLLLLLGVTWLPFPTALVATHMRSPDQRLAGLIYSGTFLGIALAFNGLWRYAIWRGLVSSHEHVRSIKRQYALGPVFYVGMVGVTAWSTTACVVVSAVLAIYFALPPRLWQLKRRD